ncbi:TPA: hypothetical protein DEP21_04425 [Patescibacteria group bacterium]|nr:hypothetical protein [Candidatus Gracilibacteria bacterium]
MKKFLQGMLKKTKSFSLVDYGVFKACLFILGLWVATVLPVVTTVNPWIYLGVRTVLYIYLVWKMFRK